MRRLHGIETLTPLVVVLCWALFCSCQRSPQLRRDDSKGDFASDYYGSKPVRTGTQRVESMGQPKKRVLVLDFWNHTPIREDHLGAFVADELKRGLSLSQRVLVPEDAKSDLSTEDLVDGDRVKVAQLVREGRRLGVSLVVIGRIKKIVFRQKGDDVGLFRKKQSLVAVEVESKIFDVQAGRELFASEKSGEASNNVIVAFEGNEISSATYRANLTRSAAREAVAGFIPEILRSTEKLVWQGRIAKMMGSKIYVNAGKASGLIAGDILRVLTPGEEIYDPASGASLGRAEGQLKGTLEVLEYIGADGAVTQIHSGANFREGDLVQLY